MGTLLELPAQSFLEPSILGIPYTIREAIYLEILEWISIELFLHVNTSPRCRDPRGMYQNSLSCLCAARIARPDMKIPSPKDLAKEVTVSRVRFENGETPLPTLYGCSKKRRVHLAKLLRYPTLLNLLETCKVIRQEVGELYLRRSNFNVGFDFGVQGYAVRPETFKAFLHVPFAGGPIYANVQRLALDFASRDCETPDDPHQKAQKLMDLGDSLRYILESLPSLQHLKLHLSFGMLLRKWPADNKALFDIVLSSLKKAENLKSIQVSGRAAEGSPMMDYIFHKCKDELKPSVTVSKVHRKTMQDSLVLPICHTRVSRVARAGDEARDSPDDLLELVGDEVKKGDVRYFLHSLKIPEISYLDTSLFGNLLMNPYDSF